jgi:hypothetical membrane protein
LRTFFWRRTAGLAALFAPTLMWSALFVFGPRRHGYNLLSRTFSELSARGTPYAFLFELGFFLIPGVLALVVALGLWFGFPATLLWRLGAALIFLAGLFLCAAGVFPQDSSSMTAGIIHRFLAQTCFFLTSLAPFFLSAGSSAPTHSAPPRRLWLATGIASFAIAVAGLTLRSLIPAPEGFFEHSFTLVLTLFILATGIWLLRSHSPSPA